MAAQLLHKVGRPRLSHGFIEGVGDDERNALFA
jgi:hypothetical protein